MLKKLNITERPYFEPEHLIEEVIKPCFNTSKTTNLLSAYFNFESFIEISESLSHFLNNDGKMKIIVSIPKHYESFDYENLDSAIIEAYSSRSPNKAYQDFKKTILTKSGGLKDELKMNKVALISYLVKTGIIKIKFSIRDEGFDHSKIYIFDDSEDKVVLSSAMNWTFNGLNEQSNQTTVHTSFGDSDIWKYSVNRFDNIWNNKVEKINTFEFTSEFADELLEKVGNPKYQDIEKYFKNKTIGSLYKELKTSPLFFEFNLGNSALLPHQIYAVNKGLDTWPIRHLFADEVGLGKTLEVGAALAYLSIFKDVRRKVILAPQAVVKQWQTEMKTHFGLDFYVLSSNKKFWEDVTGEKIGRETNNFTYDYTFPENVIISKDLARGFLNNHLFTKSEIFPELLIIDEAHHARGSKKTKSFKQTLLRRMVNDIKQKVNHIIFATATPMRTHPDEYYYLLELLGLDNFLSEIDYKIFLSNLSTDIDDWGVEELVPAVGLIKKIQSKTKNNFSTQFTKDEISFLKELSKEQDIPNIENYLNNKKIIYSIILKHNPLSIFTSRSSRNVLERYPETYKFPKRVFETSPITAENIYLEFETFFNQIMEYTDSDYLESEKSMGVKIVNNAFAKAGFKESFVSSFWSARERLINRKARIDEYIDAFQNKNYKDLLIEKNIIETLEIEEELDEVAIEETLSYKLNTDNVINTCKKENAALEELIEFSDYLINNRSQPDPKLQHLVTILNNLIHEEKPTLIFAHYIATLDSAYDEIVRQFSNEINGIGMFKGSDIWYEINGVRYQSNKYEIKQLLENGEIQILLCSEAASEGINLQAADKLINLDVPWVPSMLEQRIGRIARLGQESDEVRIYNLWYPGSYEAKIYSALLKRIDLLSLAMGHFPQIVSQKIKAEVKATEELASSLINELNSKKAETEFIGLSQLWDFDREVHQTFGNLFRKDILNMLESFDYDTTSYTFEAGKDNVFTLKSNIFKTFIEKSSIVEKGSQKLYKLYSDNQLYGFLLKGISEDKYQLISPRNLSNLLSSLFSGKENKVEILSEINDPNNLELSSLIAIYKENLVDWFIPDHSKFLKYLDKEYNHESSFSIEAVANINLKTEKVS